MSSQTVASEDTGGKVLLSEYLTTFEVCKMFGVTKMTAYKWRREHNMPYYFLDGEKRPPLRYVLQELIDWAKENNKEVLWTPERFEEPLYA